MNNGNLAALLENCYDSEQYAFVWGFTGETAEDAEDMLLRRGSMDPAMVEKAAAVLCGALCGLVPDEEIFCRALPAGKKTAAAVRLEAEIPCADPAYRSWQISFFGRDDNRAHWLAICGKLCGKLPLPDWVTVEMFQEKSSIQVAVLRQRDWENTPHSHHGTLQAGSDVGLELLVKV